MQRTPRGLREDLEARLAQLEQRAPEWRSWLDLLRETLQAGADPVWDDALGAQGLPAEPGRGTPLLEGAVLQVEPHQVRDLAMRLAGAAGERGGLDRYRPDDAESLALLSATLRQDEAALEALSRAAGMAGGVLGTVAHLVAWPLLQACGRRLGEHIPADWRQGFCPICGAWPTVAELRGLERSRRLRCAWCAADWQLPWLWCAFCGERRHEHLGSLVPLGPHDGRKIETCEECRGYLKTVSTLEAMTPLGVLLSDLETVELDLIARERGWSRPPGPGHALQLRIEPRPARRGKPPS
jgi:FdhE protein